MEGIQSNPLFSPDCEKHGKEAAPAFASTVRWGEARTCQGWALKLAKGRRHSNEWISFPNIHHRCPRLLIIGIGSRGKSHMGPPLAVPANTSHMHYFPPHFLCRECYFWLHLFECLVSSWRFRCHHQGTFLKATVVYSLWTGDRHQFLPLEVSLLHVHALYCLFTNRL